MEIKYNEMNEPTILARILSNHKGLDVFELYSHYRNIPLTGETWIVPAYSVPHDAGYRYYTGFEFLEKIDSDEHFLKILEAC